MTRKTHIRFSAALAVLALLLGLSSSASAQAAKSLQGAITAVNGSTLTVKTAAGETHTVTVSDSTDLKRIEPGQTSLANAAAITLSDLAVGDKVLLRGLDPAATADPLAPRQIVAIKAADLAQKQQQEREDWQRRGIAGLVKSIDASSGLITVSTGAGPTAKTVTVKTTAATVLKRYASGSVSPDQAQPAPISAIQAGDQIHARGDKSPDGSQITADEIYSGTFKNLSGTIASIDAAANTVSIKDLATKRPFTIHIGPDAQLHRIPDQTAQMIAARLKGTAQAVSQRTAQDGNGRAAGSRQPAGDTSQFLNRTPVIKLSDLQKGQAIMVVASEAAGDGADVNAIMLLAGVEPLLEAPAARDLLSSWSMGGGEGGGEQ